MKRTWIAAAVLAALPMTTQAQSLQYPGFYIGAEGGLNWLLNTSGTANVFTPGPGGGSFSGTANLNNNLGWTAGGMVGYDFVGPRVRTRVALHQEHGNPERSRRGRLARHHGRSGPHHGEPVL